MQYIKHIAKYEQQQAELKGWVANKRESKGLVFLTLRDGSGFLQCVISEEVVGAEHFEAARKLTLESSLALNGTVVKDEKQEGGYELQVNSLSVYQYSEEYPIAKKAHGVEFLMDNRHLWLRSKRQWAIMRIRNSVIFSVHKFFQERDFVNFDSPIFTCNAAEGSTTLFETEYYGQPAYLAQTGQLYGEAGAMAQGKIYTFGPTFRAEKSKTRRHLSEFWMIEPEMAFYDLDMNMDLIEDFIRTIIKDTIKSCANELEVLGRDITVFEKIGQPFPRITYADAVKIIRGEQEVNGKNAIAMQEEDYQNLLDKIKTCEAEIVERQAVVDDQNAKKGVKNFNRSKVDQLKQEIKDLTEQSENIPQWIEAAKNFKHGEDFGGSDETVLTRLFATPVMVYNWPAAFKAFYMKRVEGDDTLVKGVDCLAPEGYGEIVGGAERETNLAYLLERIEHEGLNEEDFKWYNELRKYGSVPHSGFGLGLERLISWICKLKHIRESIPFPRLYGRLNP